MKLSSSLEADWSTPQQPIPQTISQGTVEYKRAGMALFLLGFASFFTDLLRTTLTAQLKSEFPYCTQCKCFSTVLNHRLFGYVDRAIQCLFTNIGQKRSDVFLYAFGFYTQCGMRGFTELACAHGFKKFRRFCSRWSSRCCNGLDCRRN